MAQGWDGSEVDLKGVWVSRTQAATNDDLIENQLVRTLAMIDQYYASCWREPGVAAVAGQGV